jgi:hypothetical protein
MIGKSIRSKSDKGTKKMGKYPEHEKLDKIKDKSQAIGEFLDWLLNEKGQRIGYWYHSSDCFIEDHRTIEVILADYFSIDLDIIEEEKQKMLAEIRLTNRGE